MSVRLEVDRGCLAPEFVEITDQSDGRDVRRYGALKYSSPEQRECRAVLRGSGGGLLSRARTAEICFKRTY